MKETKFQTHFWIHKVHTLQFLPTLNCNFTWQAFSKEIYFHTLLGEHMTERQGHKISFAWEPTVYKMLYQVELGKLVKHEVTQEAELLPTLVLVTTMIMLSLPLHPEFIVLKWQGKTKFQTVLRPNFSGIFKRRFYKVAVKLRITSTIPISTFPMILSHSPALRSQVYYKYVMFNKFHFYAMTTTP